MLTLEQLPAVKELVTNAQSIMVLFPSDAKLDVVAAAIGLTQGLRSLGKDVQVFCPTMPELGVEGMTGIDEVSTQLGNRNLQVSFAYTEEKVDKVSYHIDEDAQTFNLVIQPKKGVRPLETETIKFAYTGAEADLMITVGVSQLTDLAQLQFGYENLYENTSLISLNEYETEFGTVKISTAGSPAYSEVVTQLLRELGVELGADTATNLLAGIEQATDTFRSLGTTAETLAAAAELLRAGAVRLQRHATLTSKSVSLKATTNGLAQAFTNVQKTPTKKAKASTEKPLPTLETLRQV